MQKLIRVWALVWRAVVIGGLIGYSVGSCVGVALAREEGQKFNQLANCQLPRYVQCELAPKDCGTLAEAVAEVQEVVPALMVMGSTQNQPAGMLPVIVKLGVQYGRNDLMPSRLPILGWQPSDHVFASTKAFGIGICPAKIVITLHAKPDQWSYWVLRGAFLHELGHAMGLEHQNGPEFSVMVTNWYGKGEWHLTPFDQRQIQRAMGVIP